MNFFLQPLTLLTFFPLLGVLVLLFIPSDKKNALRWTALGATLITFFISLWVLKQFNPTNVRLQLVGTGLQVVGAHELGHQWFPMQVGNDEQRYAWMDEGLTRFNQSDATNAYFPGMDRFAYSLSRYLDLVRAGDEVEVMRHGDQFPVTTEAYSIQTYEKTSMALRALRAVLGEQLHRVQVASLEGPVERQRGVGRRRVDRRRAELRRARGRGRSPKP